MCLESLCIEGVRKNASKRGFRVPPDWVGRGRPIGPATVLRIGVKKSSPDRASRRTTTRARNEIWGSKIPPDRPGSPDPIGRLPGKRGNAFSERDINTLFIS